MSITNSTVNNSDINTVAISKKGYAYEVTGNTLEIKDLTFTGDNSITPVFYKATVDTSSTDEGNLKVNISNNTVKISGNTTFTDGNSKVYASYLDITELPTLANDTSLEHFTMTNNTVVIDGVANLSNVDIYGSYVNGTLTRAFANSSYDIVSGNTLRIHSYTESVQINSVSNFDKYEFYIEGEHVISDPLLITNTPVQLDYQTVNGDYKSVDLSFTINGNATLNDGDTLTPFDQTQENNLTEYQDGKSVIINKGSGGYYEAVITIDDNNQAVTTVNGGLKANNTSKALIEGQSAALAFVNQGADLIASNGIENAYFATANSQNEFAGFGSMSAGSSRYKTGSHVDIDGYSLLVGSAIQKDNLLFGVFFEAGWSNYDSRNSFTSGVVKGDGNSDYRGAGLMARYDISDALYLDGSFHAGRTKTDFSTSDLQIAGQNVGYNSRATYYDAHLGLGYQFAIDDVQSISLSTQYLWTHQNGDDVKTSTDIFI